MILEKEKNNDVFALFKILRETQSKLINCRLSGYIHILNILKGLVVLLLHQINDGYMNNTMWNSHTLKMYIFIECIINYIKGVLTD